MTKKTYDRYIKVFQKNATIKEQDIIAFRKLLRACFYWKREKTAFNIETNELVANLLLKKFRDNAPYRITKEQSSKGIAWLKEKCFKKNGDIRNSKSLPFAPIFCEILKNYLPKFRYWTLDDLEPEYYTHNDNIANFAPIYTLHTKNKKKFSYMVNQNFTVEIIEL